MEDRVDPTLDYLYKWYPWLWSFRSLKREGFGLVRVGKAERGVRDRVLASRRGSD